MKKFVKLIKKLKYYLIKYYFFYKEFKKIIIRWIEIVRVRLKNLFNLLDKKKKNLIQKIKD